MKTISEDIFLGSLRKLRERLGLTQSEFWGRIGVFQAVGSRYEAGDKMPMQVAILLELAYGSEEQAGWRYRKLRHRSSA